MAEEPASQLRRRRISGNPNFQLNLDAGYHISEGLAQGTPSPSYSKLTPSATPSSSRLLQEFKNKAQSFDVQMSSSVKRKKKERRRYTEDDLKKALNEIREKNKSIEECEEEEIIIESEDEGEDTATGVTADRPVTPTPVQDFGTNVVYLEAGPQTSDFLKVNAIEHDCYTDVSDADSEGENEP